MAAETRNMPASVHQRLLVKARDSSRPFNELLQGGDWGRIVKM
jgi:hypothetical protein